MDGTYVRLTSPIEAFGKTYSEISLKEPSGALYMRLGEPRIAVLNAEGGGGYFVEQPTIISAYLDKLIMIEGDDAAAKSVVLSQLSLADAIAVKRALFLRFPLLSWRSQNLSTLPALLLDPSMFLTLTRLLIFCVLTLRHWTVLKSMKFSLAPLSTRASSVVIPRVLVISIGSSSRV